MRCERDGTRIASEDVAVVEGGHLAGGGSDLSCAQRLTPDVEEVTQGYMCVAQGPKHLEISSAESYPPAPG
jgi:hypothetical protein